MDVTGNIVFGFLITGVYDKKLYSDLIGLKEGDYFINGNLKRAPRVENE